MVGLGVRGQAGKEQQQAERDCGNQSFGRRRLGEIYRLLHDEFFFNW
jgi:hypothetical protein